MTKRKEGQLETLENLMEKIKWPSSVREHMKSHQIWSKWVQIVGAELSKVTAPIEIRSQILWIQVAHQAWAQQLHFLKPSILGKIRSQCPQSKLKDLQFRVGKIELKPLTKTEKNLVEKSDLIPKLSERQEMTLRAVEDDDLRKCIRLAMEAEAIRNSYESKAPSS
jgi:hypothetical protein